MQEQVMKEDCYPKKKTDNYKYLFFFLVALGTDGNFLSAISSADITNGIDLTRLFYHEKNRNHVLKNPTGKIVYRPKWKKTFTTRKKIWRNNFTEKGAKIG